MFCYANDERILMKLSIYLNMYASMHGYLAFTQNFSESFLYICVCISIPQPISYALQTFALRYLGIYRALNTLLEPTAIYINL